MSLADLRRTNLDRHDHMRNPYAPGFGPVSVPTGKHGKAQIDKMTLSESEVALGNLRAIRDGGRHRVTPAGTYTRLLVNDGLMMSDVPSESWENLAPCGHVFEDSTVLVNGLGIGMLLDAMLRKQPRHITVVENSADVIALVAPHYAGKPVTIVHADALEYKPPKGAHYDVVWHDIWPDICGDNLQQMGILHRKYARRATWQGSWCRIECMRAHRGTFR